MLMSDEAARPHLRLANAAVAYVRYLGKFFWPTKMIYLYTLPTRVPIAHSAGAGIVLAVITAAAGKPRRPAPAPLPGRALVLLCPASPHRPLQPGAAAAG